MAILHLRSGPPNLLLLSKSLPMAPRWSTTNPLPHRTRCSPPPPVPCDFAILAVIILILPLTCYLVTPLNSSMRSSRIEPGAPKFSSIQTSYDMPPVVVQYFADVHYPNHCPPHVRLSLAQARRTAKGLRVVLLGGAVCRQTAISLGIEYYDANHYLNIEKRHHRNETLNANVVNYIPHPNESGYRQLQNRICIERWISIRNFAHLEHIQKIFYIDSDALLFSNPAFLTLDKGCHASLPLDGNLPVVASMALLTLPVLHDFVRFSYELLSFTKYTPNDMRLWAWYTYANSTIESQLKYLNIGSVRDAMRNRRLSYPRYKICKHGKVSENGIYDKNIKFSGNGFQMIEDSQFGQKIKKVVLVNHRPHLVRFDGRLERLAGVHLQGTKKKVMRHLVSTQACFSNKQNEQIETRCVCDSLACFNCGQWCPNIM